MLRLECSAQTESGRMVLPCDEALSCNAIILALHPWYCAKGLQIAGCRTRCASMAAGVCPAAASCRYGCHAPQHPRQASISATQDGTGGVWVAAAAKAASGAWVSTLLLYMQSLATDALLRAEQHRSSWPIHQGDHP